MREDVACTAQEAQQRSSEPNVEPYQPNQVSLVRVFRIALEFFRGFNFLKRYCLAASIFGTSRCHFEDSIYLQARELAGELSKDGFTIISGGGSGVMQAANRGAQEAGGESVGLNIALPNEQQSNQFTTRSKEFHYFFIRKVMLSFASEVYIFFPGGFGTLDEFFEIVTLIQTKKIQRIPVILVGKEYWTPLLQWVEEVLYQKNAAIDQEDMNIYHLVDSVEEAHTLIKELVPIESLKTC